MSFASANRARETPHAIALADERQTVSWCELDDILNRAANALLGIDLGPSRRVAVFAENSAETVIAHLGAIRVGISTVPLNFHLTAGEVAYILDDSRSAALFVGPETAEVGLEAAAEAGIPLVVGWRSDAQDAVVLWEEWIGRAPNREPPSDMPPLPFLHYTSGTTGRPKGTETPPTMFAGGATVAEHFDRIKTNPMAALGGPLLVVSPLYHTGALDSVRTLATGTPVVVLGRFDAEKTLAAIDASKVTGTIMVPTHFQRLLALPEQVRAKYDVSSLRMVGHTGAACPIEVKRAMIEWLGPVLTEAYGATEAGTTNVIDSEEWLKHPGSVGKTVAPFELLVIGADGSQLGANQVGQIYFRDTTGRGIIYHNDPEKTKSAHLQPGVFTLGEMGYVDDEGYLYITDRVSDMVVSGGVNIYPAEVEQILIQHSGVADVAVIGVPSAEMGEELKALVVPADSGQRPSVEELTAYCRDRLAGYKCAKTIEFVADIGRNTMGKINKRKLRAPYWPTERTIGG
jgi:long-chain acyl-CoA synthetase